MANQAQPWSLWNALALIRPVGRPVLVLWASGIAGLPGTPTFVSRFNHGGLAVVWVPAPPAPAAVEAHADFELPVYRFDTQAAPTASEEVRFAADTGKLRVHGVDALPPEADPVLARQLFDDTDSMPFARLVAESVTLLPILEAIGIVDVWFCTNPKRAVDVHAFELHPRVCRFIRLPPLTETAGAGPRPLAALISPAPQVAPVASVGAAL